MRISIFTLVILLYTEKSQPCWANDVVNNLLTYSVNIANEISRQFRLLNEGQDFNQWFASKPWNIKETAGKKYDFIIVGSGAAGSVIANRLSEVEKWNILILETGIPETEIMKIPSFAPMSQFSPYNWGYFTEYQEGYFFGLNRNRMRWPRGRALGGSSTINYMIYTRGNRWDYDKWAEAGNQGWSYNDVLPYFIKSEKARNLTDYNPELHGNHGLLSVENVYKTKLLDAFIEAGAELGLELIDYNANLKSFGVSRLQATVKRGRRHSVASAFLWPARNRANLDIIIDAHVTKVLINPTTKAAYGVTYSKNGQKYSVFAKKEVILSAGTFNSPQLLMLSGIGPKDHLEKLGIKVLEDLPVGRNLQDHIAFPGLSFEIDQAVDLNIRETIQQISEFIDNGTGLLTSLGGSEGIGFIKTAVADYPEDYPDMELLFIGGTLASDYGLSTYRGMNIKDEVFDSVFRPLFDKHAWTIFPMLLHPKSVGYMELKSKDPFDYPRFFGNYFTDPENHDLNTFVEVIRIIQRFSNTTAFQNFGSKLNHRSMFGCEHETFDSNRYWICCLRSISITLHHQVGTAKMGPSEDSTTVVNPNLQVHGIKNLRVADCSIIPRAVGAHTNAPSIMVGEKASDIIKDYWGELQNSEL
uniref:Glucose-methanol-choline oxidoreductase N-terminal domain-containing protein n=1 Tax=Dendroctonus ponderosae TaxID=77166 RepID=A0AAR5Q9E3_DENPD